MHLFLSGLRHLPSELRQLPDGLANLLVPNHLQERGLPSGFDDERHHELRQGRQLPIDLRLPLRARANVELHVVRQRALEPRDAVRLCVPRR